MPNIDMHSPELAQNRDLEAVQHSTGTVFCTYSFAFKSIYIYTNMKRMMHFTFKYIFIYLHTKIYSHTYIYIDVFYLLISLFTTYMYTNPHGPSPSITTLGAEIRQALGLRPLHLGKRLDLGGMRRLRHQERRPFSQRNASGEEKNHGWWVGVWVDGRFSRIFVCYGMVIVYVKGLSRMV